MARVHCKRCGAPTIKGRYYCMTCQKTYPERLEADNARMREWNGFIDVVETYDLILQEANIRRVM